MKKIFIFLFFPLLIFSQENPINFINPKDGEEFIGKRPEINIEFLKILKRETVLILVDNIDLTGISEITDKGINLKVKNVLPAGNHIVFVSGQDVEGINYQKNINFKTRHTETFEEAVFKEDLSLIYDSSIKQPEEVNQYSKYEGNFKTDLSLKNKGWNFSFNSNIRYLDKNSIQNATGGVYTENIYTFRSGFNLINYLIKGNFKDEKLNFFTELGNVSISETPNTLSGFSRRGGKIGFSSKLFTLNAFVMKSENIYSFSGGIGLDPAKEGNIKGASGSIKFFEEKLEFKGIYFEGEEPLNSLGISKDSNSISEGKVNAFLLTTNFFKGKFKTEMEADFSKYDADIEDEFAKKEDKAYRANFKGNIKYFSYDLFYNYFGKDYKAIGNQGLNKDNEIYGVRSGFNTGKNNINITISNQKDNVKEEPLFPQIETNQANLDYNFNGIKNFSIGFGLQNSSRETKIEAENIPKVSTDSNMFIGRINYFKGGFNIGINSMKLKLDDKTSINNDTSSLTNTIYLSYNSKYFSISPSISLNRTEAILTNYITDTFTTALNFNLKIIKELSFDGTTSYTTVKAKNKTVDMKNISSNIRLSYSLKSLLKEFIDPTIGLKAAYLNIKDNVNPLGSKDELTLFLAFTTGIPISF